MNSGSVRILLMDVDGTLTDGGIYMGTEGECIKRFDIKDGYGIHNLLRENGIVSAVITGRKSIILENRCRELEIDDYVQDCVDKVEACKQILEKHDIAPENAAFIGDDLNDREVMNYVRVKGCPADAVKEIREIADFISRCSGGRGAVREFIEWIIERNHELMKSM